MTVKVIIPQVMFIEFNFGPSGPSSSPRCFSSHSASFHPRVEVGAGKSLPGKAGGNFRAMD